MNWKELSDKTFKQVYGAPPAGKKLQNYLNHQITWEISFITAMRCADLVKFKRVK